MPNIFGIVQRWLSHHIHNFTPNAFLLFLSLSLSFSCCCYYFFVRCLLNFFPVHNAKPQALFYYICFCCILFPLFGGRWRLVSTIHWSPIFRCVCMHMVNIFMFWAKFCALTKELHTLTTTQHISHMELLKQRHQRQQHHQQCWKWNAKSLWYVFNYER